uniref:Uncharacterized protein n=1 Tax=Anopheles quadriannulatus TaxID=34691 RepID=A0A182XTE2_ANOQN
LLLHAPTKTRGQQLTIVHNARTIADEQQHRAATVVQRRCSWKQVKEKSASATSAVFICWSAGKERKSNRPECRCIIIITLEKRESIAQQRQ